MKKLEATCWGDTSAVWEFDLNIPGKSPSTYGRMDRGHIVVLLDFAEKTARFFMSRVTGCNTLCDVEISVEDFKRLFPTRTFPGFRAWLRVAPPDADELGVDLNEVLDGFAWSYNTLTNSLGEPPEEEDMIFPYEEDPLTWSREDWEDFTADDHISDGEKLTC